MLSAVPRAFWVETDFRWHQLRSEHAYVAQLVADIESGRLEGLDQWQAAHSPRPRAVPSRTRRTS